MWQRPPCWHEGSWDGEVVLDSLVGPRCTHKCPYKREAGWGLRRGRRQCGHRGRCWSDATTSQGRWPSLEAGGPGRWCRWGLCPVDFTVDWWEEDMVFPLGIPWAFSFAHVSSFKMTLRPLAWGIGQGLAYRSVAGVLEAESGKRLGVSPFGVWRS